MAEFQYNNHVHSSTQQTPFALDCGQHLRMGFKPQPPSQLELTNEFTDQMRLVSEEAKTALTKAKDERRLDVSDIQTTWPSWNLSHCRLGPFTVDTQVSCNVYRLRLSFPMRRLYLVFNVVKLTPAPADLIVGHHLTLPPSPELVPLNVFGCYWL